MTTQMLKKPFFLITINFFITIFLIWQFGLYLPSNIQNFYSAGDQRFYIQMAERMPGSSYPPFCWRLFVPFIAGLFPDIQLGFLTQTILAFTISGVGIYLLSETIGFKGILPAVGSLLFYSIEGVRFALFDFWLPDSMSYSIIIFAIIAALRRNRLIFLLLMLIGVTVKESVLFIVPLYYSLNSSRFFDKNLLKDTLFISAPAILLLILIRLLIQPENGNYSLISLVSEMAPRHFNRFTINEYIFRALGVTAVFPLLTLPKNKDLLMRFFPFILLVVIQLAFANDSYRLIALAFPVTILCTLNSLDDQNTHKIPIMSWQLGSTEVY